MVGEWITKWYSCKMEKHVGIPSLLYSFQSVFHLQMRCEYGRAFDARYEIIAEHIPDGARVVDVCAGDCWLYLKHLKPKRVEYLGLEISPPLVRWAGKRGVQAQVFNLWEDPVPPADIVVMQASLYQFDPETDRIVQKLKAAARQAVIIAEPIKNLSNASLPLVSRIADVLTRPIGRKPSYTGKRFTQETLGAFFEQLGGLERSFVIPGGREMVGIFHGEGQAGESQAA